MSSRSCPHLGLRDDHDTTCAFPSADHRCFVFDRPVPITEPHQAHYCLNAYARCPRLVASGRAEGKAAGPDTKRARPKPSRLGGALLAALLLTLAIGVGRTRSPAHPHAPPPGQPAPAVLATIAPSPAGAPAPRAGRTEAALQVEAVPSSPPVATATTAPAPTTPHASAATAAPSQPTIEPTAPWAGAVYVVQRGDTLGAIAERYNVTARAIQEANDIADPSHIRAGQQIRIP